MTAASRIAAKINRAIPHIKTGSLRVYGDFFGRPYDNIHRVCSAHTSPDRATLVLVFDGGETLEIRNPTSASVSETEFSIASASEVRWTWFYYGRPRLPENQYFIEHVRSDNRVSVATDADWAAFPFDPSVNLPAMEIL
ncbi:hypothetical protein LGT39_02355 [Demequina sp. TTPB684]|uniref:hypothetical protein n=1 Tax=unclassified Demequina TaxID=2620311 RepID=UPI001CF2DEC8|nr:MULTISPECIES: hypothetical protein [unclassified Demequina]MCB2411689.1 hypothetical protein [Demequina sp. TTPB684]UPU88914.1 hypothetical protein LGT36_003060 [Demequina sp. TMPB413]